MNITKAKQIHFSGIKGVGMTALALYAQDIGIEVTGSDVDEVFVTDNILSKRRIEVSQGFSGNNLPQTTQVLIYSAARPQNPQVVYARKKGIEVISYAEALGNFTNHKEMIAVCGVGGKTTTTAMIATILNEAQLRPSFINGVGNIPNLGVSGRHTNSKYVVVEADDYVAVPGFDDLPKFMYLQPKIIVVTNIEFDHPDVYKNLKETKRAFKSFFMRLPKNGSLIANIDNPNVQDTIKEVSSVRNDFKIVTYGFSPQAEWRISKSQTRKQRQKCEIEVRGINLEFDLQVPGKFNTANACASIATATVIGVAQQVSLRAISIFRNTKRRFEKVGIFKGTEVWDDYAHHPKEIKATLQAARNWFRNRRIIAVFQPHTYSRTKALLDEFAQSLSLADLVIITQIYSSVREKKDSSVTGKTLAQKIKTYKKDVEFISTNKLKKHLLDISKKGDVVITMGAGDIYKVAEKLVKNNA